MRNLIFVSIIIFTIKGYSQDIDTTEVSGMMKEAKALEDSSEWNASRHMYEKAAELWENHAKANQDSILWVRYFESLKDAASTYRGLRQSEKTDSIFEVIIPKIKTKLGQQHLLVGRILKDKGVIRFRQGDFESVFRYWEEGIEILKKNLKEDDVEIALLWTNIGVAYSHTGNYQKAYENYLNCIPIFERNNDPALGQTLFNCGNVNYSMGYLRKAVHYQKLALTFYRETNNIEEIPSAVNYLGLLYSELGDYTLSLDYFLEALKLKKAAYPTNHIELYYSLGGLGNLYQRIGDYEKSLDFYQQTLKVLNANVGPNHQEIANTYTNMGQVELAQNNYEKALAYLNKSLSILNTNPRAEKYNCLVALGNTFDQLEDYEKALKYFDQAYEEQVKLYGADHNSIAKVLNNIGVVKKKIGDIENSQIFLERGLILRQVSYPEKHPEIASSYLHLGDLNGELKEWGKALENIQKALIAILPEFNQTAFTQHPLPSHQALDNLKYLKILESRAELFAKFSKENNAYKKDVDTTFQLAIHVIDHMRMSFRNEDSKMGLQTRSRDLYEKAFAFYIDEWKITNEEIYFEKALKISEKSRAIILSDGLRASNARNFANIPANVLEKESELRVNLNWFEEEIFNLENQSETKDSIKLADFQTRQFYAQNAYDSLLRVMEKSYSDYYKLKYRNDEITLSGIKQQIENDQAFISYYWGNETLYGLIITKTDVNYLSTSLNDFLHDNIETLRNELSNNRSDDLTKFISASSQLYKHILAPFSNEIKGKNLTIAPGGNLATIPFEVLITDKIETPNNFDQYAFLIKAHDISYVYSAAFLEERNSKYRGEDNVLAFAPDFKALLTENVPSDSLLADSKTLTRDKLVNLNGTVREVKLLKRLFKAVTFTKGEATERIFKELAGKFNILHLATHAIIDESKPLNSYLVFTASEDSVEDNNLYAWELYNMQLNAQMAVLSACNTGFGMLQRGEGVMSLGRAFAYAGVPSIVMSLWPAEDESTADLMKYFYEGLSKGMAKDEALRAAKVKFLEESAPDKRHPFYWAGFVVQGDAGPLKKEGFPGWGWMVIGLALLGIFLLFFRKKVILLDMESKQ